MIARDFVLCLFLVGRAGLEPATYGLKEETSTALVLAPADACDDESMIALLDEAGAGTNGSETEVARQARQALVDEIERLDAGDTDGARAVLEMLVAALQE